jgi:hypothetical protein
MSEPNHRKGSIIVDKVDFKISEEFQSTRDLNLRPVAYFIFGISILFIIFISILISQHE